MNDKRIADYFIISGLSEDPGLNTESKQLINSVLPITDITVIFKKLGETCPPGFVCIETTPGGHPADLNNGNFRSPNIQICYRRGVDKPPLVEVGVYHEDRERLLENVEVVHKTPYGRCASTGNIDSKSGTYVTYRRAKTTSSYYHLVVVDLCVILNNKSEQPPHAFKAIKKNLNKSYYGMLGSEVFLCYKKTRFSPPSICCTPQIVSRFPLQDYPNFPLPETVPLFCLPNGANIELWPSGTRLPRATMPVTTFVLTSNSAQKVYGSSLSFFELFDHSKLSPDKKRRLGFTDELNDDGSPKYETLAIKSICILSRWPFFECFEKFLSFLFDIVSRPNEPGNHVSLEHYISHFLLDVSFPTPQRPTVLAQLMPGSDDVLTISLPPNKLPLPLTGASFIHLLNLLGVENVMNVLSFGLSEQKILLHSMNPWSLTCVAEAITAMLFPFHWQCPYVPLCPLSLHGILNAPLPFIVGIDSKCFDTFTPPEDVICIDLDTKSIYQSDMKKCLNLRILPKRASRVLKSSLERIHPKVIRFMTNSGPSPRSPQRKNSTLEIDKQQLDLELEIREAFVRFMATILRGFRSYLLPITQAPTVGTTDPTSLFDFDGFLMSRDRSHSQFYELIMKTQIFTHYIEERSFVSDKDTSLAYFDDCEEKLSASDDIYSDRPIDLFEMDEIQLQTDRSVFVPAPEQSPSVSTSPTTSMISDSVKLNPRGIKFGPLNVSLFHRHPCSQIDCSFDTPMTPSQNGARSVSDNQARDGHPSSFARRTKQEIKASQRLAKKSLESPLEWSKYLVSCCFSLWFASLPSYIAYCKATNNLDDPENQELATKYISRILRFAFTSIARMQRLQLATDEICFRVLTLLCGQYGQPALAVRVFFEMRKAGIKPNAITYGYYNKAVLESKWPDHSCKPATVLWTKIRNVIEGIAIFRAYGRRRMQRRALNYMPPTGDPSFGQPSFDGWSQNSRSVYKNIKDAANGLVSSLQEIKSSFSNTNTPSKLLLSAQHREMISQWTNFFTPQSIRYDNDSDNSSIYSDDSQRMSNEEDDDATEEDENDNVKYCHRLFESLEKYYGNSSSKEDLIDQMTEFDDSSATEAMEIKMSTCSKCNVCEHVLCDEEIMSRWSHNESNLNTRCAQCRTKIVPMMTVVVEDRRFDMIDESQNPANSKDTGQLLDLNFDCDGVVDGNSNEDLSTKVKVNDDDGSQVTDEAEMDKARSVFTVPYLSPIVLRKELESVFDSSGDDCQTSSQFVDEHPIIFWNLLWYFDRISLPTHLARLCLTAKSILGKRNLDGNWEGSGRVIVKTLWDERHCEPQE